MSLLDKYEQLGSLNYFNLNDASTESVNQIEKEIYDNNFMSSCNNNYEKTHDGLNLFLSESNEKHMKFSDNKLMKRTIIDLEKEKEKNYFINDEREFYSNMSLKERIKKKKERTKMLLNKTRRDSDFTNLFDFSFYNNENKLKIFTNAVSSSSYNSISLLDNNGNSVLKNNKEMKRLKNREAAQKSRNNRQKEYLKMKEANDKLKAELEKINKKKENFCLNCKKILEECKNNTPKKFKLIQTNSNLNSNNGENSHNLIRKSKFTLITGILLIIYLMNNFVIRNPKEELDNSARMLISSFSDFNLNSTAFNEINNSLLQNNTINSTLNNFTNTTTDLNTSYNKTDKSIYNHFMNNISYNSTDNQTDKNSFLPIEKIANENCKNNNSFLNNLIEKEEKKMKNSKLI